MKFFTLFVTGLFMISTHASEKAVVQQMKGRRAILQFESDIPFSVGQKVFLLSADGSELGVRKEQRNPLERKNSIQLSSSYLSYQTKPKSTTAMTLDGRYGWNMERFEFGPLVHYSYTKDSSETSTLGLGGFFDLNMIPNKPGEDFIWGGFAEASFGNKKTAGVNKNDTLIAGGAFAKYFLLSSMLAFRADGLFGNEQVGSQSLGYAGVRLSLNHYF